MTTIKHMKINDTQDKSDELKRRQEIACRNIKEIQIEQRDLNSYG